MTLPSNNAFERGLAMNLLAAQLNANVKRPLFEPLYFRFGSTTAVPVALMNVGQRAKQHFRLNKS